MKQPSGRGRKGIAGTPLVWLLSDDRTGNTNQCVGVGDALGRRYQIRDIEYRRVGALPNQFLGASFLGITAASRARLKPPWPDLVIAAGRRTAPVARKIKRLRAGTAFIVQIMNPWSAGIGEFDLISSLRHDSMRDRPNIIHITGAPHKVTPERLAQAADKWRQHFDHLPRPWFALIVGGSTTRGKFSAEAAGQLGRMASRMAAAAGGSLLVSTSRRTGDAAGPLLAGLDTPNHLFKWDDGGENPYFGYLALADAVVVTGDSVSMCSEACAVPAPVYIFAPAEFTQRKHGRLHQELYKRGYARPFDGAFEEWSHPLLLNAAHDVAAEIKKRLGWNG